MAMQSPCAEKGLCGLAERMFKYRPLELESVVQFVLPLSSHSLTLL